jgi:hypothetical protein
MPKTSKAQFQVSVQLPEGCTLQMMKNYIEDAVCCWKGCYEPEAPVFNLDANTVQVITKRQSKKNSTIKELPK